MEDTEEIRKKIARLITERGLNYAKVSLSIGKNIAYIQQFIKNGSPRRLGEVERQKLARLLKVDEQELTDLPLKVSSSSAPSVNQDILCLIIENIENWLLNRNFTLSPHDKAELIRLIYSKICNESMDTADAKIKDFIDIYDEVRKAN
nr:MAG TPA: helix-turn-helix domain protein [Caudoviricetes sp.]